MCSATPSFAHAALGGDGAVALGVGGSEVAVGGRVGIVRAKVDVVVGQHAAPEGIRPSLRSMAQRVDVAIVGGGHNGLVAAALLARAGRSVLLLERRDHVGGAAVSERPFAGVDARLSRYSYLVSLFPRALGAGAGPVSRAAPAAGRLLHPGGRRRAC